MAKTKIDEGKTLHADDYAYAGDPDAPDTWLLRIDDKDHVQDALSRFNQADLPAGMKQTVARKLAAKARTVGIDPSGFEKKFVKSSEHADFGNQWIEIFRAGDYGSKGKYTPEDLDRVVQNYNPSFHEAPACIGHPKDNAPAYGWVSGLKNRGGVLEAQFSQVDPDFENIVLAGRYKKRSAAFYLDDDGKLSGLRHVGFLGAQPPEVKGLKNLNFDDGDRAFVEVDFGEEETVEKPIGEQIKEYFAELFGNKGSKISQFSEDDTRRIVQEAVVAATAPLLEQIDGLKGEVEKQRTEFSEQQRNQVVDVNARRVTDAVSKLKNSGRWVPAYDKMGVVALFTELAGVDKTVEFGEGDQKKKLTAFDLLLQFCEGLPCIVPPGRIYEGGTSTPGKSTVHFNESPHTAVDQNSITLTEMAKTRASEKKIDFGEALDQITAERPDLTVPGGQRAGSV